MHGATSLRVRRCREWGTSERSRQWPGLGPPGRGPGQCGARRGKDPRSEPAGWWVDPASRSRARGSARIEHRVRRYRDNVPGRSGPPRPVRESTHRFYSISGSLAVNTASPPVVLSGLSNAREWRAAGHGAGQPRLVDVEPEVEPEKMVVVERPGSRGDAVGSRSIIGRACAVRLGFRYLPATGMARG